jgi:hypothetical protein
MSTIAASPPRAIGVDRPQGRWAFIHSPTVAAAVLGLVATLLGAVVGPMMTTRAQNHEKSLDVRTTLATDMSKSFTTAVGAGQRVASGLIYGPTGDRRRNAAAVQAAYNSGLGRWQVDGGRIAAELSARYTGTVVEEWKRYRFAITRFYRLSAALPGDERRLFVADVQSYFDRMKIVTWAASAIPAKVDWPALRQTRKFRKSPRYRKAYDALSNSFLSIGDAFVNQVLKLQPEL